MSWVQIAGLVVMIVGAGVAFYILDVKKYHKK